MHWLNVCFFFSMCTWHTCYFQLTAERWCVWCNLQINEKQLIIFSFFVSLLALIRFWRHSLLSIRNYQLVTRYKVSIVLWMFRHVIRQHLNEPITFRYERVKYITLDHFSSVCTSIATWIETMPFNMKQCWNYASFVRLIGLIEEMLSF